MTDHFVKSASFKVEGMSCTNCALGVQKTLEKEGFENVDVNFASGDVRFEVADEGRLPLAVKRIEELGYRVTEDNGSLEGAKNKRKLAPIEKKFWFTAIFTVPLILHMFLPLPLLHNHIFQLVMTIPVFAVGFWHFGRSAWFSLRSGVANMDVLIFLGSTAAFVYSLIGSVYGLGHDYLFYETSASIISIVLLGNMLEHRSVRKTTSAVDDLVRLQKNVARKISDDASGEVVEDIDASLVETGDRVLINAGDKIPVDGEIYWGSASVDESIISGEGIPVDKSPGDKVVGGSLVVSGSLKVKTAATGKDTVLSQIIEMVRNAQRDKPKLQNLADRISRIFVPVVVGLAIATLMYWLFIANLDFRDALMRGIAVLVIACPCALGLAIPTAVSVGLGRSAKSGILIKGGRAIDEFASIDTVVFDKTGTLTTGKFRVRNVESFETSQDDIASILYSLESHSAHPIAVAIVQHFKGSQSIQFDKVEEQKGMGVEAWDSQGNNYLAGSYRMAAHLTTDDTHNVYLMVNDRLVGWLDLADDLKPGAAQAISFFKNKGVKTVLLSGDRKDRCEIIAREIGIDEVYSEQLPHQKLEVIEALAKGGKVAMVGDGINDAPALAKAHVGISMSDATQVAVKSAQVILLKGDLLLLSKAFGATRTTLRTVKENLFWAFFYNVAAIPLAMAGLLTPIVAAFAMAASDVIVVLNSLRLKRRKLR